jgi:hypothetical protein
MIVGSLDVHIDIRVAEDETRDRFFPNGIWDCLACGVHISHKPYRLRHARWHESFHNAQPESEDA